MIFLKKSIFFSVLVSQIIVLLVGNIVYAAEEIRTLYNGKAVSFDVSPFIKDGRTLVPFRKIFEVLGASVTWNEKSMTVTAKINSSEIVLKIGDKTATVNGVKKTLDVMPMIVDGRTMVPLRFVSENSGAKVDWIGTDRTVYITKEGVNSSDNGNTNLQVIKTTFLDGRYQPITVKKGVPVKWIISISEEDIYGCNETMVIPSYGIEKKLLPGENVIEFTPTETGIISYSCWMNMIRSKITVE